MKLWLQVLFAQGWLWRDRFPEAFPVARPQGSSGASVLWLVFGLLLVTGGAIALGGGYGSQAFSVLQVLTGAAFFLSNIGILRIHRLIGSNAFWVSLSWSSGTVALVGITGLVLVSAIEGYWIWTVLLVGMMAFCFSLTIGAIERRYLFFSDPRTYGYLLDERQIESIREHWTETFWRLPGKVLKEMIRKPPPT